MLNIYITRHGQDEDNAKKILNGHRDKNLTELGIEQAKSIGQKIADTKIVFNKIYSSPLKRTHATAKIISSEINGPSPIIYDDLIERDYGIMTGKPISSILETCLPDVISTDKINYFLNPEGAETFPDLIKRAQKIINKIKKENKDGNILLVTHGDLGMMLYAAFYNLDWKETLEKFHFNNTDLLLLSENSSADNTHIFKNNK